MDQNRYKSSRYLDLEQLADDIILHGSEERHIDYKSSMSWKDRDAKIMAIRCILGMSNLRDGGYIVFGVRQDGNEFILDGMELDHIKTFTQDSIDTDVKNYAEPYVELRVTVVPRNIVGDVVKKKDELGHIEFLDDGGDFVVIQISEFDEFPVICDKDGKLKNGKTHLREGAMYIRPRGKVETSEVRTQIEMREVVEMATDKNLRSFIARMGRAGILGLIETEATNEQKYKNQLPEEMK
jgi:hypothetical protein